MDPSLYIGWGINRSAIGKHRMSLWKMMRSRAFIGEGNGTPLQYSCLENPMDGGAWWAAVYGVAQSRTWLKRLSSSRITSVWKRNTDTWKQVSLFFFFCCCVMTSSSNKHCIPFYLTFLAGNSPNSLLFFKLKIKINLALLQKIGFKSEWKELGNIIH